MCNRREDEEVRRRVATGAVDATERNIFSLSEVEHLCATDSVAKHHHARVLAAFYHIVCPASKVPRAEGVFRVLGLLKNITGFDFNGV